MFPTVRESNRKCKGFIVLLLVKYAKTIVFKTEILLTFFFNNNNKKKERWISLGIKLLHSSIKIKIDSKNLFDTF